MALIRKNIAGLCAYQPGKPIEELKRQLKLKNIIKLASNENPLGAGKKAKLAIIQALNNINRYPEGSCFYLRRKLSRKLRLSPDMLIFGNGSDELIDIVIKAFVEDDENIVTADVTFLEYHIISRVLNRRVIKAGLCDYRYDLNALLKKINKKTKVVFIANPNNPTGTYLRKSELDEFIRRLPARIIAVLDEAYDIFVDAKDFPKSSEYLKKHKNVVILKTFSKSYGLAGLRIGYGIANRQLIAAMEKVRPPFNVNILAQAAAAAALNDRAYLKNTRRTVSRGRDYLYKELAKIGLKFLPTAANFILIDAGRSGKLLYRRMLKYGVIVRDMQQYGLDNFIRVTIGRPSENKRFIEVLKKLL